MTTAGWKIAFLLPSLPGGGVEVSMLRIASYLKGKGHEVTIFTTEQPGAWFDRIAENGLVGKHVAGLCDLYPQAHAKKVFRLLHQGGYQVVFPVFDRYSQAVLSGLPDATIVIPLLRNDHSEIYEIGLGNKDAWNIAVGNSPRIHQQARQLMPHRPLAMIPNGVEVPADLPRRVAAGGREPLRMVFVGRLVHESKGVLLLPEILAALVARGIDCRLAIAGDGVDREQLVERVQQKGLGAKVEFLGMVGRTEVFSLLRSAHVFLLTSFYEGLPNVVLEAQANGCVPVATLLPGVTDFLVKEGETGFLVPPGDVAAFVDRIEKLYLDPQLSARMSESAFRYMRDEFSVDLEGSRYLRVIEEAMAGEYPLPRPRRGGAALDTSLFPKDYLRKKKRAWLKRSLPGWLADGFRGGRSLKRALQLFVKEYVTNRIVAYVPSMGFRSRYYRRISRISMDGSVNIQMGCYIYNSDAPFVIGEKSVVNRYCTLDRRGGLYIGSRVNVSAEVAIYTAGHDPQLSDFHDYVKPVTIEDYVWLGTRSMIMPGVTVGEGAVVLPGAIVTRDVEPYAIVGGTPARKVGERNRQLDYDPSWWPLFQ